MASIRNCRWYFSVFFGLHKEHCSPRTLAGKQEGTQDACPRTAGAESMGCLSPSDPGPKVAQEMRRPVVTPCIPTLGGGACCSCRSKFSGSGSGFSPWCFSAQGFSLLALWNHHRDTLIVEPAESVREATEAPPRAYPDRGETTRVVHWQFGLNRETGYLLVGVVLLGWSVGVGRLFGATPGATGAMSRRWTCLAPLSI